MRSLTIVSLGRRATMMDFLPKSGDDASFEVLEIREFVLQLELMFSFSFICFVCESSDQSSLDKKVVSL